MNKIPLEHLLKETDELLRSMPSSEAFQARTAEKSAWLGRASAVAHAWDEPKATVKLDPIIARLNLGIQVHAYLGGLIAFIHEMRHDLCLRTQLTLNANVGTGAVFDYFDEIRKVIETAKQDVLFIDPYLDAEFASRYLPHISTGVSIRLLGREKIATLMPAVELLRKQNNLQIEVRSAQGFHDRYFIIDNSRCFQSGASFKDGAKKAPTTLTEIVDAFPAVQATYESLWSTGQPQEPKA